MSSTSPETARSTAHLSDTPDVRARAAPGAAAARDGSMRAHAGAADADGRDGDTGDGACADDVREGVDERGDGASPGTGPQLAQGLRKPRYGDELELVLERFDERGRACGAWRAFAVSVRHGVPGARVRVRVLRRRRDAIEAHVLAVLDPGPHAVAARCAHFPACGGCSLQDLDYAQQLAGLARLVDDAFRARGLLDGVQVDAVLPAHERFAYRNKMEFTFGTRRWIDPREPQGVEAGFALGLHAADLFSKVLDVRSCAIQSPAADAIVASARTLAREHRLEAWDLRTHTGLLRHLVLRTARATGELLVNLVTSSDDPERVLPYVRALLARHPEITTLVQNVNSRAAQTALGERELVHHGPGSIVEELDVGGRVRFRISANSFFQTNTAQAEALFRLVREEAELTGAERVFDLYCGTGAIGLVLARDAHSVVGFEQAPSSVLDAQRNAELNGIANVRFVAGDVLARVATEGGAPPDVVVVDPPRAGLHPDVPPRVAALGAGRIVYVSCNPRSAARDVEAFAAHRFALVRVRPIDLFPHTPHVESVLTLVRAQRA